MKYAGMPFGMWALFAPSFRKQLTAVLGYDAATARAITKKAKPQYRQIIRRLPEFEKADRFKMNLVNCAMIGAFILSMPQRPEVDRLTDYYAKSMMTKPMQWFCRKSGKSKFTPNAGLPHYVVLQQRFSYLQPVVGADFGTQLPLTPEQTDFCARHGVLLMAYSPLLGGLYEKPEIPVPVQYRSEHSDKLLELLRRRAA